MSDKRRQKREPKHIRLYASITGSEAWKHLSGNAIKVLLALVARDDGTRNGNIGFSCREAAEATMISVRTCWRCLVELQEKGFIACVEKGGFSRKVSHSTLWRYTWAAWPQGRKGPTRDFEKWRPDGNSRLQILSDTDANFVGSMETPPSPVADFAAVEVEAPQVSDVSNLTKTTTLIVYQGEAHAVPESDQRKQANPPSWAVSQFSLADELADLRHLTLQHLAASGVGSQSALASAIGCPSGTFSKFIGGRNLPQQYRAALTDAIKEARHAA